MAAKIDHEIAGLYTESVAEGESTEQFVYAKLALRCYELLRPFDDEARSHLFEIVDELIIADGVAHPNEVRLRDDIQRLLAEPIELEMEEEIPATVARPSHRDRQTRSARRKDRRSPIFYARRARAYARATKLAS